MSAWRVIITDTESLTGVAPVCEHQDDPEKHNTDYGHADVAGVFDCCPHPHIETWSETTAVTVALKLTHSDAEVCS